MTVLLLLLTGCELTDKPSIAYTASNVVVKANELDKDIEALEKTPAFQLWMPSQSGEIQTQADAQKAAVAGYVRLHIDLDYIKVLVNKQNISVTKADKLKAEKILKADFGISESGRSSALEIFETMPKNILKSLLEKYSYKAAYIRQNKLNPLPISQISKSLSEIEGKCVSKKALFAVPFIENQKAKIAAAVAKGDDITELSKKYNADPTSAIQNGYIDCYVQDYFTEETYSQLNNDENLNKIIGPVSIEGTSAYVLVKPISKLNTEVFKDVSDYSSIQATSQKLQGEIVSLLKESPPTLNKKYGFISVSDAGLSVKLDKKFVNNE